MVFVIHVFSQHPLSRFHTYFQIPVSDEVNATSIEMAAMYLFTIHHGRPDVAEALIKSEEMKWNPERIREWLRAASIGHNVDVISETDRFYQAALTYQFKKRSEYAKSFQRALQDWDESSKIEFRIYSGTSEMILSSGLRFSSWQIVPDVPGFSVYGELHSAMVPYATMESKAKGKLMKTLLTDVAMYENLPKRSVLAVMDSQGRYIDSIQLGDVVPISGGKYVDMLNVLTSGDFQLNNYKYIVIYCGTNVATKRGYDWRERQQEWSKLKNFLVDLSRTRPSGSILFSCAFDHPDIPGNKGHARYVESELSETRVQCLNWEAPPGNPFILRGRRFVDKRFFQEESRFDWRTRQKEKVHFHLNHLGLREVWKRWCTFLPGLKFFPYTVSARGVSVPKETYDPDHESHHEFSRKRKFRE